MTKSNVYQLFIDMYITMQQPSPICYLQKIGEHLLQCYHLFRFITYNHDL